jgi:hypothetical protein
VVHAQVLDSCLDLLVQRAMVLREVDLAGLAWKRLQRPVPLRRIGICRRSDRTASPAAGKFELLLRAEVERTRERTRQAFGE